MSLSERGDEEAEELGISPMAAIAASLSGGPYYMISEASELTGVPVVTLRRWMKKGPDKGGTKAPSFIYRNKGLVMYLYTDRDIEEVRARRYGVPTIQGREQ